MGARVKICGVTTLENALLCAETGADLLGLNFYPPSPRSIQPEAARQITDGLRMALGDCCPLLVGVFVTETAEHMLRVLATAGLDAAQLSGDESPGTLAALHGRAYKAIRPRSRDEALALAEQFLPLAPEDERLPSLLVDAYHKDLYGGTGEEASIEVALAVKEIVPRLMLAGGLTPENVAQRVGAIRPWAVDTASGVEDGTPGFKDPARVRAFVAAARTDTAKPRKGKTMDHTITPMQPADWRQVAAIYQEGIDTGLATLETETPPWEKWDSAHVPNCRLVARNGDRLLGWAALTPVSGRCVYAGVAEVSVYVAAAARGQGVGKALLTALVEVSEQAGFWALQAGIFRENTASITLHARCGFREVGYRERIGQLHGVWKDVVLMERRSHTVGI
jgi:phosphoribosylanthranilate isomerase/L-amino acid N-acyltransferase YncA